MQGGLNMINIYNFNKALKVSWIKKLISHQDSQWQKLLQVMYKNFTNIITFGDQWLDIIMPKIQNKFWQNVLKDWKTLIKSKEAKEKYKLQRICISYNSKI